MNFETEPASVLAQIETEAPLHAAYEAAMHRRRAIDVELRSAPRDPSVRARWEQAREEQRVAGEALKAIGA